MYDNNRMSSGGSNALLMSTEEICAEEGTKLYQTWCC